MAELIDVNLPIFCGPIIKRDSSKACSLYFDLTLLPSPSQEIPKLQKERSGPNHKTKIIFVNLKYIDGIQRIIKTHPLTHTISILKIVAQWF